jgi:hypothetical protein
VSALDDRPQVLTALMHGYNGISEAWAAVLADTDSAPDSPHMRWRDVPNGDPTMAWQRLLQGGEIAASATANAVRAHLSLLSRAYWPDVLTDRDDPIQFPAAYPPARAVMEGTAVVGWMFDPVISPQDRAQRAAQLLLWSQAATGRHDAGWHEVATAAGFDIRASRKRPESRFVWTGEGSEGLKITRMIAAAHGTDGADLYREWNPVTHPDPIALAERATVTLYRRGYGVGGLIREDRDVEVCAHVADMVAAGIETIAAYYGKSAARADDCHGIALVMREHLLPHVVEAIKTRQARNAGSQQ